MNRRPLLFLLCFACAIPARADWNTGVGRNASRTSLAPDVGPYAAELLWQGSRPTIVSQQGVAAGDLFVVPRIQSFTIPTGTWIVAHDLFTGEERWAIQLPFHEPDEWRSRVTAIRDRQVYATRAGGESQPGYLYALDPADGSILWQSEERIDEATTESAAFASNGDLIIGNWGSIVRIDKDDGTTLWSVPRSTPTSNGLSAAVFGQRAYIWEPSAQGPVVTAIDIKEGTRLYSSEPIAAGYIQQLGLMVGPDGTVYAPRSQNNAATDYLVALEDSGAELLEKWRTPLGYVPFGSFGIGPDGTVYSYSRDGEVVRLDPDDGSVLDTSTLVALDFPFEPRIAIDAEGKVYLTNGGFPNGRLFAFDAALKLEWSVDITNVNLGGPVIGQGGVLVVCGVGSDVRAFANFGPGFIAGNDLGEDRIVLSQNFPNPFRHATEFGFRLRQSGPVDLAVFDATGRLVRRLIQGEHRPAGTHRVIWNGRDDSGTEVASGVYLVRATTVENSVTARIAVIR